MAIYLQRDTIGGHRQRRIEIGSRRASAAAALDTALLGIVIDNAEQRVQVLARRATLHRYGDTPLHWTAEDTYLGYDDMGAEGDHLITMELDPDVASTAEFVIYDSGDVSPKPVRARLYTVTLTQVSAGPPVVYAAALKPPIHGMGDINIIPLFGDHPVEEDLGS